MATTSKTLEIKIETNAKTGAITVAGAEFGKLKSHVDTASKGVDKFKVGLGSLAGAVVSVYAIKEAFDLASSSIMKLAENSGKFETTQSVLSVLEGNADRAKKALAWIKDFSLDNSMDIDLVQEAFIKAKAYGIDPYSGSLQSLADASKGMGKSIVDGVEAVADAMTGENERLKEFTIKASVSGEKIAYNWTNTSGKARHIIIDNNSEIIQSTLYAIFNSKYKGAAEAQVDTWAGMTSNIRSLWSLTLDDIAQKSGIFEGMKSAAKNFSEELTKLRANEKDMALIGDTIRIGISSALSFVAGSVYHVSTFLKTLQTGWTQLGARIENIYLRISGAWDKTILEMKKSAKMYLPEFFQEVSGFGLDPKTMSTLQEKVRTNDEAISKTVKTYKTAGDELDRFNEGADKIYKTVTQSISNFDNYTNSIHKNTVAKTQNNKIDFGEKGSSKGIKEVTQTLIPLYETITKTKEETEELSSLFQTAFSQNMTFAPKDNLKILQQRQEYYNEFLELEEKLNELTMTSSEKEKKELKQFEKDYLSATKRIGKKPININLEIRKAKQRQIFEDFKTNIADSLRTGVQDGIAKGDFTGLKNSLSAVLTTAVSDSVSLVSGGGIAGSLAGGVAGGVIGLGINKIASSIFGGRKISPEEIANKNLTNILNELRKQTDILSLQGLEGSSLDKEMSSLTTRVSDLKDALAVAENKTSPLYGNKNFITSKEQKILEKVGVEPDHGVHKTKNGDQFGYYLYYNHLERLQHEYKKTKEKLNSTVGKNSLAFESTGKSYYSLNTELNGDNANDFLIASAKKRLDITSKKDLSDLIQTSSEATNILASADKDWQDLSKSQQKALITVKNFGEEINILNDSFKRSDESLSNITAFNDSFKTSNQLLDETALKLGVQVPKSLKELNLVFEQLKKTGNRLTKEELEYLFAEKKRLEAEGKLLDSSKKLEEHYKLLSSSLSIIGNDIVAKVQEQNALSRAYGNVRDSITETISSLTDSKISFAEVTRSIHSFNSAEESQKAHDNINKYYQQQAELLEETKNKERDNLTQRVDLLNNEKDVLRSLKDFADSLQVENLVANHQTEFLFNKYNSSITDLKSALKNGDENSQDLASRTTDFASKYLDSLHTTATSNAQYDHERNKIINQLSNFQAITKKATLDTLETTLNDLDKNNSKKLEELKKKTVSALRLLDTKNQEKQDLTTKAIENLTTSSLDYLGENSPIVAWLKTINSTFTSYADFQKQQETNKAYSEVDKANNYLSKRSDVKDFYNNTGDYKDFDFSATAKAIGRPNITLREWARYHYENHGKDEGMTWRKGGFTGVGGLDDIAGVVHKNEYVAPAYQVKKYPDLFRQLDSERGFKNGGFTSDFKLPANNNSTLANILQEIKELKKEVESFKKANSNNLQKISNNTQQKREFA